MSKWLPITKELCVKCYYYRCPAGSATQYQGSCDYIGVEGHSRIFENGKRKEPTLHHMCDSFTPYTGKKTSASPWKKEGSDAWKRRQQNIRIASGVEED